MSDNVVPLRSKRPMPDGWYVKIARYAEQFWVKVKDEEYGTLTGTVANDVPRLPFGSPICLQREEILEEVGKP